MSGELDSGTYRIGDALDELRSLSEGAAAVVCLDDAWARPGRQGEFGVEYPTHDLEVTFEVVAACWRVLKPGGWLIADADDWLAPRLETHIRKEYGDVTATGDYEGGGYRRRGSVTYIDKSGDPDRSTAGMYLANAGYSVLFAHKGPTLRRTTEGARQVAHQPRRVEPGYPYGWGSVKPIAPYRNWIKGLTDDDELVVVPCAGTAPGAIAAEDLRRRWLAIDCEPEAREAYLKRRAAYLEGDDQTTLPVASDGSNTRSVETGTERP